MVDHNAGGAAPRFSRQQYEILLRCSEKQDLAEWTEWRKACPDEPILLEGADLRKAHLVDADLPEAHLEKADLREARLDGAYLWAAWLQGANLHGAHLPAAKLIGARLEGAHLREAHLEGAYLGEAHLEGADLWSAQLQGANLWAACLQGASLWDANLQGAWFSGAHLEGVNLHAAQIEGADFHEAIVDGATLLSGCAVDRQTNFTTVALDGARVDPGLKQLLQYNVRRLRWEKWYQSQPRALARAARTFWALSDYGHSTRSIMAWFMACAAVFAAIYYVWGLICYQLGWDGLVANLFEVGGQPLDWWVVPFRAAYLSVVTMTTLGFGDLHASPNSIVGHMLLVIQAILGYVLLGALLTRFAVLFTAGGPAATFPRPKKQGGPLP